MAAVAVIGSPPGRRHGSGGGSAAPSVFFPIQITPPLLQMADLTGCVTPQC